MRLLRWFRSLLVGKQLTEEDVRRVAKEEAKDVARGLVLVAPSWDETEKSWIEDELDDKGNGRELLHAAGPLRIGTPLGFRPILREDIQLANSLHLKIKKDISEATLTNDGSS